jgi:hypothetical protein
MLSPRTSAYLTLALAAGLASGMAPAAKAAEAVKAKDFLNSLGVATHLNYTDGTYANYESVIADLNYLGIHKLRDATPDPYGGIPYENYITALDAVTKAGNQFDFITAPGLPLKTTLDQLDTIERLHPGSVLAVEGPNETNNNPVTYQGHNGTAAALAYQRDLYRAVHGSRLLRGVAVYYYTGFDVATKLTGLADFANCHPYSHHGEQPSQRIATEFGRQFTMAPPYPRVITEAGFFNVPSAPNGVDDATQAKDTLNLYMDAFAQGVTLTYVYQLVSAYPNQFSDTQSGMFRIDHSPKPVATAIHNLTTILADDGHGGTPPASLDYAVAAMPVTGHTLLLESSSGVFDIILWSEPTNWNYRTHRPVSVSPTPVTITLSGTAGNVAVYDPLVGTKPITCARDVNDIVVGLADHPLIIEVHPTRDRLLTAASTTATDGGSVN